MSVHVNEFLRKKGKNDLKYIELLEETLNNQKEITAKAVTKIRELTKENKEIRAKTIEEFAERLKEKYPYFVEDVGFVESNKMLHNKIDEIAKELKGE